MGLTNKLRTTAFNLGSFYKILVTGLLIYELVKFRMKKDPQHEWM